MGNIQVMPAHLANQIAAGEVVERPASCVKELIENSIDADARSILVQLEEGGIRAIVVQDDGVGMDAEDARLAFSRHATSKLKHERDLFRVLTLGFRGEALASIAAIARVTLRTRQHDVDQGIEVSVEGTDAVTGPTPVGMAPGTRIEVRDLFFNTPARLKYLRTVQTEQARAVEVVQRAALARPDIAFRCITDGHTLFQTPGRGDPTGVLAALYGVGEARQMLPFTGESPDYRVHGFLGRPTQAKVTRTHGYIYINGRPIRNLALHQAIANGYQHRLMVGRHPVYVLYIDMDPTLVDVNIHPHKAEVRFSEERDLCRLVQHAVEQALDQSLLIPTLPFAERSRQTPAERLIQAKWQINAAVVRESAERTDMPAPSAEMGEASHRGASVFPERQPMPKRGGNGNKGIDLSTGLETALQPVVAAEDEAAAAIAEASTEVPAVEARPDSFRLRPIGQALGMYIVADDGESLYIIDQHAAHERVLFEKFDARMRSRSVRAIPLLTPYTVHLSPTEHVAVTAHLGVLAEMGLEMEQFGGSDFLVRTVPDIWEGLDAAQLVNDLVADLIEGRANVDVRDRIRDRIVTQACKAAIKANWRLSTAEIEALCDALSALDDPFHCPHGRPVFLRMTSRDLEKGFRRIV